MPTTTASLERVSVSFGATLALRDVSIDLHAGEIHALLGENGAGKSTALRVFSGETRPSAGRATLPPAAQRAWAPQEIALPLDLTAAEWISLGREPRTRLGLLDRGTMARRASEAMAAIGAAIDPQSLLGNLPAVQRKQVQLARALAGTPSLLLIDEPTAVLGVGEARDLHRALRSACVRGSAIAFVSHHLPEILTYADRVTILRDGVVTASLPLSNIARSAANSPALPTESDLVALMVGRPLSALSDARAERGQRVFSCRSLAAAHVRGIDLELFAGEVVGMAGLVGAGRSEILEAIAGRRRLADGTMEFLAGPPGFLPEDRHTKGCIPTFGVRENLFLPAPSPWLRTAMERSRTSEWIERLRIRTPDSDTPIPHLSGGNQQKVLLARALASGCRLLLLDEPTAGVDARVKDEIHAQLRQFARSGGAVLMASSDLTELRRVCDRIVALRAGSLAGSFEVADTSEQALAAAIFGSESEAA